MKKLIYAYGGNKLGFRKLEIESVLMMVAIRARKAYVVIGLKALDRRFVAL